MKYFLATIMALGLTNFSMAGVLEQTSLQTLISNSDKIALEGDVHAYETVASIYNTALSAGANIENNCVIVSASNIAKCTLWITYHRIGECTFEYAVDLTGTSMAAILVKVSRGD